MARFKVEKTSFTAGEISPDLLGRSDLTAFANGARRLRNIVVHPTGGISRRAGLRYIGTARGTGRLIAFEFNTEQVYLLVFTDAYIEVYRDGILITGFTSPWSEAQIEQISWTQSADTLLVVHPDVAPYKITRTAETSWTVATWTYQDVSGRIFQPHHKFADDDVTLTPGATTGTVALTASADLFVAGHVGVRFRIEDKEVEITGVTSATQAQALVKETLVSTTATKNWTEQSYSAVRGWPVSTCFQQNRLVIGGSRDLPNRLWFSKSADLFNFDLGTGLDDESIEFAILSDQVNAIRAVFSSRHLQVFTSGAEWMVSGNPLTPANVQLHRQTRVGSVVERNIPPRDVDGATLFAPRDGTGLREFLFADVEQAYQATDMATLAHHLVLTPKDQDFDRRNRLFYMVMSDGSLATLTVYRAERVIAWTRQETAGAFQSIAAVGGDVYVMVLRDRTYFIEVFDGDLNVDAALKGTAGSPATSWSGLSHLEGKTVTVLADGAEHADKVVSSGAITTDVAVSDVQIGLGFAHVIEPLPPVAPNGGGKGGRQRPVSVTMRLHETPALRLDTGRGLVDVPFKRFGSEILDAPPRAFTGVRKVRAYGWRRDGTDVAWRIEQSTPLPFTLLSVVTEISVNG